MLEVWVRLVTHGPTGPLLLLPARYRLPATGHGWPVTYAAAPTDDKRRQPLPGTLPGGRVP